jgi:murein DD-endopeptidase
MGNAGYFKFTKDGKTKYARFLHLSEVPRKSKYKKGEVMALTGNTGMSTGPHLHHDLWKVPVDYNILRSQAKIKENMIDPYAFYRYEVDRVVV